MGYCFLLPYIWVTCFLLPYMGLKSSVVKIDLWFYGIKRGKIVKLVGEKVYGLKQSDEKYISHYPCE